MPIRICRTLHRTAPAARCVCPCARSPIASRWCIARSPTSPTAVFRPVSSHTRPWIQPRSAGSNAQPDPCRSGARIDPSIESLSIVLPTIDVHLSHAYLSSQHHSPIRILLQVVSTSASATPLSPSLSLSLPLCVSHIVVKTNLISLSLSRSHYLTSIVYQAHRHRAIQANKQSSELAPFIPLLPRSLVHLVWLSFPSHPIARGSLYLLASLWRAFSNLIHPSLVLLRLP